jgi:hypothetical protein
MHFGPNLTYLESFKGRVPEKLKLEKNYMIKKIALIYGSRVLSQKKTVRSQKKCV